MPWSPQAFPNLDRGGFTLTGPRTDRYNCFAWAAGDDGRWWWPVPIPDTETYWPPGAPREATAAAFVAAFECVGYVVCDGGDLESGVEKIALYHAARTPVPTHASRQLADGRWTSKLGVEEDITHELDGIDGPAYGAIVTFMARPLAVDES